MKFIVTLAFTLAVSAVFAVEPVKTDEVAVCGIAEKEKCCENLCNIGRGIVNIGTCFLEVPRCIVLRNNEVPVWGFVGGAVEGAGATVIRAFSGVTDVVMLGFLGKNIYNDCMPEYVWQSKWKPEAE